MNPDTTGRPPGSPDADPVAELARQLGRLVDRLRSLSDLRLARASAAGATRADQAHALAQRLADHAAALSGEPSRGVPRLTDLAVGDQVAVTGNDLLAAAAADPRAGVGSREADRGARLADALLAVRELSATL